MNFYSFIVMRKVLDIDCGDGKVSHNLSTRIPNGELIAIDPSSSMFNLSSKFYPKENFPNLNFEIKYAQDHLSENE